MGPYHQKGCDMTGLFVVFEGADGTGKSTQVSATAQALQQAGHEVIINREPGGSDVAEALRSLVLDPTTTVDDMTETLLFAAARADHMAKTIRPALDAGKIVISDRFVGSSVAYQSAGRGVSQHVVEEINQYATGAVSPDITIVLDMDTGLADTRRDTRGTVVDRMESAPDGFQEAVRASFLVQAETAPERHLVINADQPASTITDQILTYLQTHHGVTL